MSGESDNGTAAALEDADMPPSRVQENWAMRLWSWIFGGSHSENSELKDAHSHPDGCRMTRLEFEQAIEDRKSEVKVKAEGDRLEGLQRIATTDMMMSRTRTGCSPVELFPNEIWLHILKKMTPQDRYSMFQVHSVFRDLLEPTYFQDVLFPLVLDYELPLLYKYLLPVIENSHEIFSRPDLKELMALRLVSKSLRISVDDLIESRLLNLMRDVKPQHREIWKFLNSVDLYAGQSKEELEGILENSRGLKRFFLRALNVDFSERNFAIQWIHGRPEDFDFRPHFDNLKDKIPELLEHVGTKLLYFNLTLRIYRNEGLLRTSLELYNIIREMLMLMPSLKWLVLRVQTDFFFHDMGSALTSEYEAMPLLRHLERFDLNGRNETWIGGAIVSANPHIKTYQRTGMAISHSRYFYNPSWLGVPLECASLWMFDALDDSDSGVVLALKLLQQIPENNWALRRLSITFRTPTEEMTSMNGVFQFTQRFPTLEDVSLYVDRVKIGDEMNFLRLPNLKYFLLEFGPRVEYSGESEFFFSLQFLFHCKKLTTLVWRNLMNDSKPIRRMMSSLGAKQGIWMDFKGGNVDLRKSNVWDVFAQLRIITVSFREEQNQFWSLESSEAKWLNREYQRRDLVRESDVKPWFLD